MCCEQSFIDLSIRTNEQQKQAERRSDDVGGKRRPEQRSTFIFIFNEARDEDRATRQSRGLDTVLAKKRNRDGGSTAAEVITGDIQVLLRKQISDLCGAQSLEN